MAPCYSEKLETLYRMTVEQSMFPLLVPLEDLAKNAFQILGRVLLIESID